MYSPMSEKYESRVTWVEEGKTTFKAAAFAYDMFESEIKTSEVMVVAPRLDEHALASGPSNGERHL